MENDKVNQLEQIKSQKEGEILTPEEKKRLTDFFALLIEIDRRENVTKYYDKQNK